MTLEPRKWTPVLLDITALSDPNLAPPGETGVLRFTVEQSAVWCDDVVVLDNTRNLLPESDKSGDAWSVRERGLAILIEKPGSFSLRVPSLEAGGDVIAQTVVEMHL